MDNFRERFLAKIKPYDAVIMPCGYTPPMPIGYGKKMGVLQSWIMLPNVLKMSCGVVPIKSVEKAEEVYEGRGQDQDPITDGIKECLRGSEGLPVGVQVCGMRFEEERCLRVMMELDEGINYNKW